MTQRPAALFVVLAVTAATALPAFGNAKDQIKPRGKSAKAVDVQAAARKIDQLAAQGYKDRKLTPTRRTNDTEFLRRVYLDAVGRIPTLAETQAFLDDKAPNKRAKLIDKLLESPGHVSHMYNFWADILRIQSRMRGDETQNYAKWVKQSVAENKPFDLMVNELVSSSGRVRDDGAAGYWIRDMGMTLDTVSLTSQVFLGTQIGCAQCHDHPFDDWTQMDFYQFATFAEQVTTRGNPRDPRLMGLRDIYRSKKTDPRVRAALQRITRHLRYGVMDDERRKLKLPKDYKYKNGKPGDTVEAKVIFGELPAESDDITQRQRFADWLTAKDNPRFAKAIANRMWKHLNGFGLIEPIDEFYPDTQASNPALMAYLTQLMKDVNFDLRAFQRVVLNSKTYQLTVPREELTDQTYAAQGAVLRRMTAEQVWDSIVTLTVDNPDTRQGPANFYNRDSMMVKLVDQAETSEELLALAKKMVKNEKEIREKIKQQYRDRAAKARKRGFGANLARASAMPQPAQPGSFLEQFGQSDRQALGRASVEPTVPQALALMNGLTVPVMLNPQAELRKNLADADSPRERIEMIYLSILSRKPATGEMKIAMEEINRNQEKGYSNLVWALVNGREFIFVK